MPLRDYPYIISMMEFIYRQTSEYNQSPTLNIQLTTVLKGQGDINMGVFMPLEKDGRYTWAISHNNVVHWYCRLFDEKL